jgi:hypothetical protein
MTRGRKALTPDQQVKLRHVADSDDAWRKAKKYEYEKARLQAEERIAQYAYVRDQAVYDAVEAGVPKVIVGRDGLGTSNPHAVNEAYSRVVSVQSEVGVPLPKAPEGRFKWGRILAKDERWVYGWVLDSEHEGVRTSNGVGDGDGEGFFSVVDRFNGVTTMFYTPGDGVLTTADPGWEDIREWAAAHFEEA